MVSTREMRPNELIPLREVPLLTMSEFRTTVLTGVAAGARLAALFGRPLERDTVQLMAVLADGHTGSLAVFATVVGDAYPALTPECPQAHWFEREIAEQWGVRPEGHPWLKPIRFHRSYRPGMRSGLKGDGTQLPSVTDFFQVQGEEVHEVASARCMLALSNPVIFAFSVTASKCSTWKSPLAINIVG